MKCHILCVIFLLGPLKSDVPSQCNNIVDFLNWYGRTTLLIITHELDACRAYSATISVLKHDPCRILNPYLIVWNDKWKRVSGRGSFVPAVKNSYLSKMQDDAKKSNIKLQIIRPYGPNGEVSWRWWGGQQIGKMRVVSRIQTDYYLVLDSKNILIAPLLPSHLYTSCGLGKKLGTEISKDIIENAIFKPYLRHVHRTPTNSFFNKTHFCYTSLSDHSFHYIRLCYTTTLLGVDVVSKLVGSDSVWFKSITPSLLHTQTVRNMLNVFLPKSNLTIEKMVRRDGTEFFTYDAYVNSNGLWCEDHPGGWSEPQTLPKYTDKLTQGRCAHSFPPGCVHVVDRSPGTGAAGSAGRIADNWPPLAVTLWRDFSCSDLYETALRIYKITAEEGSADDNGSIDVSLSPSLPRFFSLHRGVLDLCRNFTDGSIGALAFDALISHTYKRRGLLDVNISSDSPLFRRCF